MLLPEGAPATTQPSDRTHDRRAMNCIVLLFVAATHVAPPVAFRYLLATPYIDDMRPHGSR